MIKLDNYAPTPFYFINDDFDASEIQLQLDLMKEKNIKSFFLHVRDGITNQAYGTALFFQHIQYVVQEAVKRNLTIWLYDEDSYPSGNVGGNLVFDHPELQARSLITEKVPVGKDGIARKVLGKVSGVCGYLVRTNNGKEEVVVEKNCFGPVRQQWYHREMNKTYYMDIKDKNYPHVRGATCYTEVMFELQAPQDCDVYVTYLKPVYTDMRYGTQTDCLNKATTKEFISRIHEKYYEYVGKYFGGGIKGIFMDEPSLGGSLPYTAEFNDLFYKDFGYDPEKYFYKLCDSYQGDLTFRRQYVKTISKLFENNFIKPIKSWCKKHNLLFTGHFSGEEDLPLQAICGNNIYKNIKNLDIPGFDLITNNVGNSEQPALLFGSKLVTSSALHSDKNIIMSECFALNPYNFGYDGLKAVSGWLFACGINWLIPHAFYYGYSAMQRTDAGKSFFFQDALFDEYLKFSLFAERICKIMNDSKPVSKVCVVMPNSAISEEVPFVVRNNFVNPSERSCTMRDNMYTLTSILFENHIAWHITDTESALNGKIQDGKIQIGKIWYDNIIVVEGGSVEKDIYNRLNNKVKKCTLYNGINDLNIKDDIINSISGNIKNIICLEKNNCVLLYNNSSEYVEFSLNNDKIKYVYNPEDDKYYKIKDNKFALNGFETTILLYKTKEKCDGNYILSEKKSVNLEYKQHPSLTYIPVGAKKAIIKYNLKVKIDNEIKEYDNIKLSKLRDIIGTFDEIYQDSYKIPYFDTAPRLKSFYPVYAEYVAEIEYSEDFKGILFDKGSISGDFEIMFNDKLVKNDDIKSMRVYDKSNKVFYPDWKNGINTLKIIIKNAGEFDGVDGEIYII